MSSEDPQSCTLVDLGLCIQRIILSINPLSLLWSILSKMFWMRESVRCDSLKNWLLSSACWASWLVRAVIADSISSSEYSSSSYLLRC